MPRPWQLNSPSLFWTHPVLGVFDLEAGDNTLTAVALQPNPKAEAGHALGLDYVFLVRQ